MVQRSPSAIAPAPPVVAQGIQRAPEPAAPEMPLAMPPAPSEVAASPAMATPAPLSPAPLSPATPASPAPAPGAAAAALTRGVPDIGDRGPSRATPIVSSQALRTRVQRAPLTLPQRSATGAAAEAPDSTALPVAPAAAGGPVKIHRDGQASQLSTALDARSFTHGGEIFLPANHGPLTSGTGKALLAHELTHVAQQRRLGSALPAETTPHGKSLEADAVAAERAPDMTLALPQSPGDGSRTSASAAMGTSPDMPSRPAPQRAPNDATPRPTKATADASSPGQPAGGHAHTEQELEVLAHQLYHRIGRHLRRELLVDRERLGFALDLP